MKSKNILKKRSCTDLNRDLWFVLSSNVLKVNDSERIETLLNEGADVNAMIYGDAPLHMAVKRGDIESVKLLVNRGAHINIKNQYNETPLLIASNNARFSFFSDESLMRKREIVKFLLSKRASISQIAWSERCYVPLKYMPRLMMFKFYHATLFWALLLLAYGAYHFFCDVVLLPIKSYL